MDLNSSKQQKIGIGTPWEATAPTWGGHQHVATAPLAYFVQSKFQSETPDLHEQFSKIN